MTLRPEQKKMLRDSLVAALAVPPAVSLPLATLLLAARAAGFHLTGEELLPHLKYLCGLGLAREQEEKLSAAVKRWEITAEGTEFAEREGLV